MESIGEKLRTARDNRGITIDQATRETHIARNYLIALEAETFDDFPGETYLIGFLRSYSKYLELNDDEMVALYRNIQIQEQPAPIEELLSTSPDRKRIRLFVVLAFVAVIIVGGVLLLVINDTPLQPASPVDEEQRSAEVGEGDDVPQLDQEFLERRFYQGERIAVPIGEQTVVMELIEIGETVTLGTGGQIIRVGSGEQRSLDLTGDGNEDVQVLVRQIDAEDTPPSVVARLDRVMQSPNGTSAVNARRENEASLGDEGSVLIAQFEQPEEYFMDADFRGYTMFRYEIDSKERREQYFQRGDLVRDSVQDTLRLWASNGGNVRLRVAGIPVELGDDGEVVAVGIRWVHEDNGPYNLELYSLDADVLH